MVGQGSGWKPINGSIRLVVEGMLKGLWKKRPLVIQFHRQYISIPGNYPFTNRSCSQQEFTPWGETPFESLAGTRCMSRWDEGSWDTDPHRHGRFTIIVDRGKRCPHFSKTTGCFMRCIQNYLFCTRHYDCSLPLLLYFEK